MSSITLRAPQVRRRILASVAALFVAAAGMAACSDDDTTAPQTRTPSTLAIMSGNDQSTTANGTVTSPFVVQVLDQFAAPLPGVTVAWAISTGTGVLSAASSQTDSEGKASVNFTAGSTGGTDTISATVGTLTPVTFNVTVSDNTIS
ncbi:MAG: Ig-like domain-containing protein [Gemmatimonadaceae bacterium]